MKLNDALKWLEEEEKEEEKEEDKDVQESCFITKQPIVYNITLPCGHAFEYDALFQNLMYTQKKHNYHTCPYCRSTFSSFIPYYETNIIRKYRHALFKNNYLKCSYIYKSGKKKGCSCDHEGHLFKSGKYCFRHKRQMDMKQVLNIHVCSATLRNGKSCSCKVFDTESQLCKRHFNLKNKELNKESQ